MNAPAFAYFQVAIGCAAGGDSRTGGGRRILGEWRGGLTGLSGERVVPVTFRRTHAVDGGVAGDQLAAGRFSGPVSIEAAVDVITA